MDVTNAPNLSAAHFKYTPAVRDRPSFLCLPAVSRAVLVESFDDRDVTPQSDHDHDRDVSAPW